MKNPPRGFVRLGCAATDLGSVVMHLEAEINWRRPFHGLIDGFDGQAVAWRQKAALEKAGVPAAG